MTYLDHNNIVRLHRALSCATGMDKLPGVDTAILAERDRKLLAASEAGQLGPNGAERVIESVTSQLPIGDPGIVDGA